MNRYKYHYRSSLDSILLVILYFFFIKKSIRNVWLFSIKIQFYIWLLLVEKSINNICFNNCLYLWGYRSYIICSYEYMKSTLVVDISIIKNWIKVYWIIKSIKYTLFYWLIKEHWILSYLGSGIWRLCLGEFLRKGDFKT